MRVRSIANWLNLSTPLGLAVATCGGATLRPGPNGLRLAEGYRWTFPTGSAFTIGDVVITRTDFEHLRRWRPRLLEHEEVHARQWMACLGLPFIPLYVASMAWSMARTGDRAARCPFEVRAGLHNGGYADVPVRPIRPVIVAGLSRFAAIRRTAARG